MVALVMGGRGVAKVSTVEAVVAGRIRTRSPIKEWVVIVIKTHIVAGNPTETQEEKGNPIMPFAMVIIETAITEERIRHLTPQVAEVVLGGVEVISHTKQAVATADED